MSNIGKYNEKNLGESKPEYDTPTGNDDNEIKLEVIHYNCTECSSLIEILSINEENNTIEFKCMNKENNHKNKTISIKEYLEKMEGYNSIKINEDDCQIHNNKKYTSYCFDCGIHLCDECLKTRTHIKHIKNNIIEIKPLEEELKIIKEIIKDYENKISNLKISKINKSNELKNILNENEKKENEKLNEIINKNKVDEEKELKLNKDKYLSDTDEINKKYKEELKLREDKYNKDNIEINNKYKKLNEKEKNNNKLKIDELHKKFKEEINNLEYDKKIKKIENIKKINKLVYNTYKAYNNNYFNAININNILLCYYKNENIRNNIMKNILKDDYENKIKIITERKNENTNINNENTIKIENNQNNIINNEVIEKYEKIINEMKEENERQKKMYEDIIAKLKEENEKKAKEFKEQKNDEILIRYKIDKNKDKVKIFDNDFVENNKNLCKIIYEGKEYELQEEFNTKDINKEILEIKLKGINKITNMYAMFYECSSLLSLPDISNWDTSNVTNMSCVFGECTSLLSLPDISKWNTSKVEDMSSMFYNCNKIESIPDISNWDISNVNTLAGMFNECTSLKTLPDISKWNISKVNTMSQMFSECRSLQYLPDLSNWNISNISIYSMFYGVNKKLKIPEKFNK